jgi:hypothetical protein
MIWLAQRNNLNCFLKALVSNVLSVKIKIEFKSTLLCLIHLDFIFNPSQMTLLFKHLDLNLTRVFMDFTNPNPTLVWPQFKAQAYQSLLEPNLVNFMRFFTGANSNHFLANTKNGHLYLFPTTIVLGKAGAQSPFFSLPLWLRFLYEIDRTEISFSSLGR